VHETPHGGGEDFSVTIPIPGTPPNERSPSLRISVVVVANENPEALRATLVALFALEDPDLECVVVDLSRTKRCAQVVERTGMAAIYRPLPGWTQVCEARNMGMLHGTGEAYAFLAAGAEPATTWAPAVRDMLSDVSVGAVACRVIGHPSPYDDHREPEFVGGFRASGARVDNFSSPVSRRRVLHGSEDAFVVRRDAVLATGRFDPAYGTPADFHVADYCARLARHGYATLYDAAATVVFGAGHAPPRDDSARAAFIRERNHAYFLVKNLGMRPAFLIGFLGGGHLLAHAFGAVSAVAIAGPVYRNRIGRVLVGGAGGEGRRWTPH